MEERFLVRVDEEYPSDKRLEVQFVEAEMGSEYKKRLDALVEKLDRLSLDSNAEVLEEIRNILSDIHATSRAIDGKYYNIADALNRIEGKQAPDTEKLTESLEGLRVALERKYFDIEDRIHEASESARTSTEAVTAGLDRKFLEINDSIRDVEDGIRELNEAAKATMKGVTASLDNKFLEISDSIKGAADGIRELDESTKTSMEAVASALESKYFDIEDRINEAGESTKTSVESLNVSVGKKFYEINDNIQDIKDKINKRDDSEVKDMLLAISDKIDAHGGDETRNAMAELIASLKTEEVKNMVADLTIHVENLAQKYDAVSQNIMEKHSDDDIMDRHIVSELETIRSSLGQSGLSEETARELTTKLDSVKKSVTSAVNRSVRSQQKVDKTVKDFNAYLVRLNSIDYMLKLLNARTLLKTKRRLPKWAREKKTLLDKLIVGLEDEVADILIVNAVPKAGITSAELGKAIGRTRKKTMERVAQLIAGGFMEERRVGRKRLYFLVG